MAIVRVFLSLSDILSLLASASLDSGILHQGRNPNLHMDTPPQRVKLGSMVHVYPTDLELSLELKAVRLEANEADDRFDEMGSE